MRSVFKDCGAIIKAVLGQNNIKMSENFEPGVFDASVMRPTDPYIQKAKRATDYTDFTDMGAFVSALRGI